MTTYNGEKFLREQLDSMLTQSRPIDELVVCDDGSTDGTVGILNEFSKRAPFPVNIIVNEKNLGSTKNFEKAMSLCTGDIILLCDHDDVWLHDKVKILEEMFLSNPNCAMAFTDAIIVDENNIPQGQMWAKHRFNHKKQTALKKGNGLHFFIGDCIVTGATAAVSMQHFKMCTSFPDAFIGERPPLIASNPNPIFRTGLIHDHWLAAVAALKGLLFFSPEITINYRVHASQQIGVESKMSITRRLNNVNNLEWAISVAQTTLAALDGRFGMTEKQRQVFTDKIEFFQFRKNLSQSRFKRLPKIVGTLLSGKYHAYSSGFLSAAKDMVVKK